jgi:hypothetical protein
MGANVFRRPQTQRDVARIFSQVKGSPLDSGRRLQTRWNSLTRKRSLVQIQYGPPGISCSWPYDQVALCGPTTGFRARAKTCPGHSRMVIAAGGHECRRCRAGARERFRHEVALKFLLKNSL